MTHIWIVIIDHLLRQTSIGSIVEVSWLSVRLVNPKVKGSEVPQV